ncbi:Hsp20/alpha crystallin family protein [Pontibacter anaerobius]|uniref:Hsp20/alpha crystallin family protein n=1 Tax=Pontibacter anaerobius TaxID=2993940 RepID=A0ABT3RGB4_9BACT|nr:Hsp20/alpha crystallin family protein [Pontibacter anaerobius]MCX2740674.1 Hsp20/alpha crystallin family protein [Pontibacter anaerobius]
MTRRNRGSMAPARSVFSDFFSDVDRFFENDLWGMPSRMGQQMMANVPATNIRETDKGYDIEVAAPGMKKEDFNIDVNEGMLTISSEKEEEQKEEQENYTRREYNYSSFSRSFRLPESVKEDDIKANYKDGVLHVMVPKGKDKEKPSRKIKID